MARGLPSRRLLIVGLSLSAIVHSGVGFVANITPLPGGDQAAAGLAPVELAFFTLPEEPERVPLGLERSEYDTEAWLGFAERTDHQAPESEVEQSALTTTPAGGDPSTGAPVAVLIVPSENQSAEPTPTPLSEPEVEVAQPPVEQAPPQLPGPDDLLEQATPPQTPEPPVDPLELLAPPEGMLPPATLPTLAELIAETTPRPAAEPPAEQPERPEPLSPLPTPPPADEPQFEQSHPEDAEAILGVAIPRGDAAPPGEHGDIAGEKSESESDATSLTPPIDVRPGRVAAAQGLQITTVRPVFDNPTIALARPRSPTLIIEFGKDGTVRRARFLPGRSTGEASVDQPLLDAIYRWTAKGEALARLTDDPDDTVAITMRIIMR